MVHKQYLIRTSDFFKRCCNGHNWKEVAAKIVEMPEETADSMSIYLHWLYKDAVIVSEDEGVVAGKGKHSKEQSMALARLYVEYKELAILADRLGDSVFGNAVVEEVIKTLLVWGAGPNTEFVSEIYAKLPASSPMRQLLIDIYRDHVPRHYLEGNKGSLPKDFIFDLMLSFANGHTAPTLLKVGPRCKYHVHNEKVPKCTGEGEQGERE